ncbi:MAG: hypothetical protein AB8G95_27600 [Anaerolineae bacterium]
MLKHIPLLRLQRDLYDLPRGPERFQAYIAVLKDSQTGDMSLPLGNMNPMGKDHIPKLLDAYLALSADEIAQTMIEQVATDNLFGNDEFQTALVIADDAHGQWTNRISTDFKNRYDCRPMFRRSWLVALLWTSETPSKESVEKTVLETIYRGVHIQRHGYPANLKQLIQQEGFAQAKSGAQNKFDSDELEYTRELFEPLMQADDEPTLIAALFGDPAAKELGHQPLGLSKNAGLELGLYLQKERI